jgi:hypothetical protein
LFHFHFIFISFLFHFVSFLFPISQKGARTCGSSTTSPSPSTGASPMVEGVPWPPFRRASIAEGPYPRLEVSRTSAGWPRYRSSSFAESFMPSLRPITAPQ